MKQPHLTGQAIAAIILATGVSLSLVLLSLMEVLRDGSVTEAEATLFATALGAATGGVVAFLGSRSRSQPNDEEVR